MLDRSTIDAVVFDIGGVFLIPHGPSVRAWLDAAGHVVAVDDDVYHRAHYEGVAALAAIAGTAGETDPAFWGHYDRAYLTAVGIPAEALEAAHGDFGRLFTESTENLWRGVIEANVTAFARIAASSLKVGVVSNNDGSAEAQMLEYGVCQVGPGPLPSVLCIVDSTVLGVAKPDPAIFAPALEALGTAPERTLYVGDTVHADVAGARAGGLQVVQLDPYDLHVDYDHDRFPDVATLADWLLGVES